MEGEELSAGNTTPQFRSFGWPGNDRRGIVASGRYVIEPVLFRAKPRNESDAYSRQHLLQNAGLVKPFSANCVI